MLAGLIAGFLIRDQTILLITLAIMGAFWALVNINSLPMVYDLGGEEVIGALTGLYYFSSSAAAITGPILAGWIIDLVGHTAIWPFSALSLFVAGLLMSRIQTQPSPP